MSLAQAESIWSDDLEGFNTQHKTDNNLEIIVIVIVIAHSAY